jgi:hypothetical protein
MLPTSATPALGVDVDVGGETHGRRVGPTGSGEHEGERIALDALAARADVELVEAVKGERRRAPAPLPSTVAMCESDARRPGPRSDG